MKFRQYRPIMKGEFLVAGGDCSTGAGDYSVTNFYSKNFRDVPLVYSSKDTASIMTVEIFPVLEKLSDLTGIKPVIGYERNNGGNFEMDHLAAMNRLGKYTVFRQPPPAGGGNQRHSDNAVIKLGIDTNSATRPAMLQELKDAIDCHTINVYDRQTIEEMYTFIKVRTAAAFKAQADKHAHDDHVMSLAVTLAIANFTPDVMQAARVQASNTNLDLPQFSFKRGKGVY